MQFIEVLKVSEASSIFHVNYDGEPRVLKVFHNDKDWGYAGDGVRDLNRARCEIRAYCRLKKSGLCDGGTVPKFYGYTLAVNPASFAPHLDSFQRDNNLPSVILIEYLPNPQMLNCVTYSKERMAKVVDGIRQVNSTLVEHNDPYPKNVLIVPGDPERVVWIDFDVAIVYPDETYIGERERRWLQMEITRVESFGTMLVGFPGLPSRRSETGPPTEYQVLLGCLSRKQGASERSAGPIIKQGQEKE